MLKQVTVFLENEEGRLAAMCRIMAEADINMSALTVADTASFGVVRMLVDKPSKAVEALLIAGYRAKLVEVSAVCIPNVPGGLAKLLDAFDEEDLNIEYAYCFASSASSVVLVVRVEEPQRVAEIAAKCGYDLYEDETVSL